MNGQYVSRKELLQVIDDHWMLEDPDRNEYAFLFRLIQERHRTRFEQTFQQSTPEQYEAVQHHLRTIDQERNRAEEILYWIYLDKELRQQGRTFPDQVEAKHKRGDRSV
ncbi:MAG: hypothetical protein KME43_07865 [Myxacorys chilensis ATA2-1-KO14]|nr:hypothetical protein [Myxacorys chilensis ATA2-1-KO14]